MVLLTRASILSLPRNFAASVYGSLSPFFILFNRRLGCAGEFSRDWNLGTGEISCGSFRCRLSIPFGASGGTQSIPRLSQLVAILKEFGAPVVHGGDFDDWDFSIHGGLFGTVRVITIVEEHSQGRQLFRFRAWPKPPAAALVLLFALAILAGLAGLDHAWWLARSLGFTASALGLLIYLDCAIAMGYWRLTLDQYLHRSGNSRVGVRPAIGHDHRASPNQQGPLIEPHHESLLWSQYLIDRFFFPLNHRDRRVEITVAVFTRD